MPIHSTRKPPPVVGRGVEDLNSYAAGGWLAVGGQEEEVKRQRKKYSMTRTWQDRLGLPETEKKVQKQSDVTISRAVSNG